MWRATTAPCSTSPAWAGATPTRSPTATPTSTTTSSSSSTSAGQRPQHRRLRGSQHEVPGRAAVQHGVDGAEARLVRRHVGDAELVRRGRWRLPEPARSPSRSSSSSTTREPCSSTGPTRFQWVDDNGARDPGLVPYRDMPKIERDDYVFNANDSFWVPHARHCSPATTRRCTAARRPPARRARGRTPPCSAQRTRWAWPARTGCSTPRRCGRRRSRTAGAPPGCCSTSRWLPAPRAHRRGRRCARRPHRGVRGARRVGRRLRPRPLGADGLAGDDDAVRRHRVRGCGSAVRRALRSGRPDAHSPCARVDTAPLLEAMGGAVLTITAAGFALDTTLGAVQFSERSETRVPIHGGVADDGVTNVVQWSDVAASGEPLPERGAVVTEGSSLREEGYRVNSGTSFIMTVDFTGTCPRPGRYWCTASRVTAPHRCSTRRWSDSARRTGAGSR